MSLKKTSQSHHSSLSELNITPLLDLVFVLLVIFIITTPQMMNNLEMTLPSGKPPPQNRQETEDQQNRGGREGTDVFERRTRSPSPRSRTSCSNSRPTIPDVSVVVKGADDVDYQNMINVLDVLQQLDITKVGLATEAATTP